MGGRSQLQSIKLAVHTTTQVHEDWDEKDSAPIAIRSHNNAENGLGLQVRHNMLRCEIKLTSCGSCLIVWTRKMILARRDKSNLYDQVCGLGLLCRGS